MWISSVDAAAPISLNSLRSWANTECAVSAEVVARALTRVDQNIGFLKAAEGRRAVTGKRLFVVDYSSYGASIKLPNLHSFIENNALVEEVHGNSGECLIEDGNFTDAQRLKVAWQEALTQTLRRRAEFRSTVRLSGKGYWISVRADRPPPKQAPVQETQLTLF
jgi:hypothetical protein